MMIEPFPKISKTFSLVIQQERNINVANPPSTTTETEAEGKVPSLANHVQSNNRGGGYGNRGRGRFGRGKCRGQGSTWLCTHCNKTNHTIDTCYFLHGFPPGYQSINQKNSTNSVIGENDSHQREGQHIGNGSDNTNVSLTQNQYKEILELIQQSKQQAKSSSHSANTVMSLTPNSNLVSGKKFTL